jgi:hypothetical protein
MQHLPRPCPAWVASKQFHHMPGVTCRGSLCSNPRLQMKSEGIVLQLLTAKMHHD